MANRNKNTKLKEVRIKKTGEMILTILPILGFILGAFIVVSQQNHGTAQCPASVGMSIVETWNKGEVSKDNLNIIIADFDKRIENNYMAFERGERIPKDTILKIDFEADGTSSWRNFPVKPIAYNNNFGLFQTIAEFSAPTSGFCVTIEQSYVQCPVSVSKSVVKNWTKGEVSKDNLNIIIADFDKQTENNYMAFERGDRIPKDTILKIDFEADETSSWRNFPVKPIAYNNNFGLFQTIAEFSAPTSGFCVTIEQSK